MVKYVVFDRHHLSPGPPSPTPQGGHCFSRAINHSQRSSYLGSPHPRCTFQCASGDFFPISPRSFACFDTSLQKSAAQPPQIQSLAASLQNPGDDVQKRLPRFNESPLQKKGLKMNPQTNQSILRPIRCPLHPSLSQRSPLPSRRRRSASQLLPPPPLRFHPPLSRSIPRRRTPRRTHRVPIRRRSQPVPLPLTAPPRPGPPLPAPRRRHGLHLQPSPSLPPRDRHRKQNRR
jgi:hypothetical protein